MADDYHVAYPKLYGAPAYARPPRPALPDVRPFDPDELPLEAHRADEESGLDETEGEPLQESTETSEKQPSAPDLLAAARRALGLDR